MDKLAYFKIQENMTPRDASDILALSKKSGFDHVILLHDDGADLTKAKYKEKLLSVFRAAFRHKVNLYLSDDSFINSGTGFGQVSSVKDTWQKMLAVVDEAENTETEVLAKKDGKCVVAVYPKENEAYPYGHYPDLTDIQTANMVIEAVYVPIMREYNKFAGYELKGFFCRMPMFDSLGGEAVPYSKAAFAKMEKKYKKAPDVFSVAEKGADYGKYMTALRESMEENFVMQLKKYCIEHKMELIVQGGEKSASYEFCKKSGIMYLTDTLLGEGFLMGVTSAAQALGAYSCRMGVCMAIAPGMDKIAQMGTFFEKHEAAQIVPVENFEKDDGNCYILTNVTEQVKELGFLSGGDWVIYDWEKDEIYEFGKKKTYKFYPYSFLCIKRKKNDMYPDSVPVRVGGVVIGDWEEEKTLRFTCEGNAVTFRLPDELLSGKCIELVGDLGYLKIKLGYNEYSFVTGGCVLPLYDFLCGVECNVLVYDGKISEIKILSSQ